MWCSISIHGKRDTKWVFTFHSQWKSKQKMKNESKDTLYNGFIKLISGIINIKPFLFFVHSFSLQVVFKFKRKFFMHRIKQIFFYFHHDSSCSCKIQNNHFTPPCSHVATRWKNKTNFDLEFARTQEMGTFLSTTVTSGKLIQYS